MNTIHRRMMIIHVHHEARSLLRKLVMASLCHTLSAASAMPSVLPMSTPGHGQATKMRSCAPLRRRQQHESRLSARVVAFELGVVLS